MKRVIIILSVLLLGGCVVGPMSTEPFFLGNNTIGYKITCEGMISRCLRKSKSYCSKGYDILSGRVYKKTYSEKQWKKCNYYSPIPDRKAECTNGYKLVTLEMDYPVMEILIKCWER